MARDSLYGRLSDEILLYIFLGFVLAVGAARLFVLLSNGVNFALDGIYIHHLFFGLGIVMLSGILSFVLYDAKNKELYNKYRKFLAGFFGFGAGLITDEASLLVTVGQTYTLPNYYSSINFYSELSVVVILFIALLLREVMRVRSIRQLR
jgi:hypothetical protein